MTLCKNCGHEENAHTPGDSCYRQFVEGELDVCPCQQYTPEQEKESWEELSFSKEAKKVIAEMRELTEQIEAIIIEDNLILHSIKNSVAKNNLSAQFNNLVLKLYQLAQEQARQQEREEIMQEVELQFIDESPYGTVGVGMFNEALNTVLSLIQKRK